MKIKSIILKKRELCKIWLIIIFFFSTLLVGNAQEKYLEIDSYALPVLSIEYRGSLIMEPQDLLQAQTDFPELYEGVDSYEDLRSSKLVKIDDTHWVSFYFPVYAVVCLPVKLVLKWIGISQYKCFAYTNVATLWIALYAIYRHIKRSEDEGDYWLLILLSLTPIWHFITYIGIESVAYSMMIIAMVAWEEKKWHRAALIISVTCMANPTIMGFGIVMFLDYFVDRLEKGTSIFGEFSRLLSVCACYIPSLIPFAFNLHYLGTINPTISDSKTGDTILDRMLSYFFDLNIGLTAVSVVLMVLFLCTIIYAISRKDKHLWMMWSSVVFTTACFSLMIHINCGTFSIARYVLWVIPTYIFSIWKFVKSFWKKNLYRTIVYMVATSSVVLVFFYNGGFNGYSSLELSAVSKAVLNHFPQLYISFCDSTFNSRVNHIDGAYDVSGYTIYTDSVTSEVRKIMYCNTEENRKAILEKLTSKDDPGLLELQQKMKGPDGRICYINVDYLSDTQYEILGAYSSGYFGWVYSYYEKLGEVEDTENILEMAESLMDGNQDAVKRLYDMLDADELEENEYIHTLYWLIFSRQDSEEENRTWTDAIRNGADKYGVFEAFINSDEFTGRLLNYCV